MMTKRPVGHSDLMAAEGIVRLGIHAHKVLPLEHDLTADLSFRIEKAHYSQRSD